MKHHFIYWWNVENLFDVFDSNDRPDYLQNTLNSELEGWTSEVLQRKIENLAAIIQQFNDGKGPDILGVCEVENRNVVERLADAIQRTTQVAYNVIHHNADDNRGIDVAFLYRSDKYRQVGDLYSLEVMKRHSTRDVVQIMLETLDDQGAATGNELVIMGNHWPSRMGGQYASEPYRIMVAETVSYWMQRIYEIKGDDTPVILMGDFNDNPYDRSMTKYLLGEHNVQRVIRARSPKLLNLMYSMVGQEIGTHVYGSEVSLLDQFLVSKSIASGSNRYPFQVASTKVFVLPELIKGTYNTPVRFSRPSAGKSYNPDGYSDHLPIELILTEQ